MSFNKAPFKNHFFGFRRGIHNLWLYATRSEERVPYAEKPFLKGAGSYRLGKENLDFDQKYDFIKKIHNF